jgi:hypothetical protein
MTTNFEPLNRHAPLTAFEDAHNKRMNKARSGHGWSTLLQST